MIRALSLIFTIALLMIFVGGPIHAQQGCQMIYGGGVTTQTACPTPTTAPAFPQATPSIPSTSKGGLPVYQSGQVNEMPASGPEAIVLGALPALGALGFYLRRKTA